MVTSMKVVAGLTGEERPFLDGELADACGEAKG